MYQKNMLPSKKTNDIRVSCAQLVHSYLMKHRGVDTKRKSFTPPPWGNGYDMGCFLCAHAVYRQ